jgi:hypothetical protein
MPSLALWQKRSSVPPFPSKDKADSSNNGLPIILCEPPCQASLEWKQARCWFRSVPDSIRLSVFEPIQERSVPNWAVADWSSRHPWQDQPCTLH